MSSLKLRDGFYWTGIIDDQLRVFDIIMETKYGTTYNSYVLKAGGKTVLFETAKAKFTEQYLQNLSEVCDLHAIDYLVVNHTEPDHAGSVEKLLELSPQMKILGTACAIGFLKEIVNRDFTALPVKDNQEMQLGDKTLRFLVVPNLHWPDSMYTYIPEEGILLTCDSFGSHYCQPDVLRSNVTDEEGYKDALKYYFDGIIGPFKPFMLKALNRVEKLDVSLICTGHGPVLDSHIEEMYNTYREWCTPKNPNPGKTVVIPYVSAYGYTAELAEKIAEGIRDSGPVEVRCYDMVTADKQKVLDEIAWADGFLLGSPTILGQALEPIYELTLHLFGGVHGGKHAAAFGSYGWSGEAVPHLTERLKQLRMKVHEGLRIRFKPGKDDLVTAYEYGYQFGCAVLDKPFEKPVKGGKRLVKCLVCGEVFDASLESCPVCGVGKDKFVPYEESDASFRKDTNDFYIILGGGAAALNAAKAIRERDKTGRVVMVSEENYLPYSRPMLTKSLTAGLDPDQLALEPLNWYTQNQVFTVLGRKVVKVDTEAKEVVLDGGDKLSYTRLIYALGSECFVPDFEGSKLNGVTAVRRFADVEAIRPRLVAGGHAVVIGGGVLGLEAAWQMRQAGLEVTVLERAESLMNRQLNPEAGALLAAAAQKQGVNVLTGVEVARVEGTDKVTGVVLADGRRLDADVVLVSAGVRANVEIARSMGLAVERAVVVDEHMQAAENVYACGDCAQFEGVSLANWTQAVEEGRVAGANAAGEAVSYKPVSTGLNFEGFATSVYAAGDNGSDPKKMYKTLESRDQQKAHYRRLTFFNGRLCGVVLLGDTSAMAKLTKALEEHATYKQVLESGLWL